MPIEIKMPSLSPTMEEGNMGKWMVKEGDKIADGQVIAEIETDKATMEVESLDAGIMGKILISDGTENVKVGSVIAVMLKNNETLEELNAYLEKNKNAVDVTINTSKPEHRINDEKFIQDVKPSTNDITHTSFEQESSTSSMISSEDSQNISNNVSKVAIPSSNVNSSPLARRIAFERGVDIDKIFGTGPNGRVIKRDVEIYNESKSMGKMANRPLIERGNKNVVASTVQMSGVQKAIAKKMIESKTKAPHFYLSIECEVSKLLTIRQDINKILSQAGDDIPKITVNDLIVKASAIALSMHPRINRQIINDEIVQNTEIDISIAISTDTGLFAPKLKNLEGKSIIEISRECKDIVQKTKDGKLTSSDMQGGSISISNLGMYPIEEFYAIINYPQSGILAIGSAKKTPVVDKQGNITVGDVMKINMSADHRVLNGSDVAKFLETLKNVIESPVWLMLE